MKRAMTILVILLLVGTPAAHAVEAAAAPVPGRFCKTVDARKVVTTAKYGKVQCLKREGRYRWVDIRG